MIPLYWAVLVCCTGVPVAAVPKVRYHALQQYRIPEENVTAIYQDLASTCTCMYVCQVLECHAYTTLPTSRGRVDCHVRVPPLQRYLLGEDPTAATVMRSDYRLYGELFYSLRGGLERDAARDECHEEGGQLAVLNADHRRRELTDAMLVAGMTSVLVGLTPPPLGGVAKLGNPVWTFHNGTTEEETSNLTLLDGPECFAFEFTKDGPALHSVECGDARSYACQRDY